MLSTLCLVVVCLGVALADPLKFKPSTNPLDASWEQYKLHFGKVYEEKEDVVRRGQWEANLVAIQSHNLEADMAQHTFNLGLNEYADLSPSEYKQYLTGYRPSTREAGSLFMVPLDAQVPDTVDWRDQGYVTLVKNQARCGSCWAFSATGSLEGQHFRKTGKLVSLSEQNLVDCSGKYGNDGCEGGLMDNAFQYIQDNKGIDTEAAYPYEGKDGTCTFKASDVGATDTGFVDIPTGDEVALMQAVATVGPVSVGIDAGHITFMLYKHGVYSSRFCSTTRLDHGVLVVGYGTEAGQDYWLVKNSWGASWGDHGYIKIARNMDNMCGIATAASYPLV